VINVGIDPIALSIAGTPVRWYSIMMAAATLTVIAWAAMSAYKIKFKTETVYMAATWAIVGGLVGARLVHVIDQWDYYKAQPMAVFGLNGLAIFGAILGASAAVWLASKVHHFSFAPLADMVAPGALLAQAIGRIGCAINGCCDGKATALPWGFVYTNPDSMAPIGVSTQPSVVYELLFDLVLFAIVWRLRGRLRPAGSLFVFYLAAYAVGRFVIASTRPATPEGTLLFGWLTQPQLIALVVGIITIPYLLAKTKWNSASVAAGDISSGGPGAVDA
jgi:phosphatidylglycerol:prolipoprotein diacylglycerol transferase